MIFSIGYIKNYSEERSSGVIIDYIDRQEFNFINHEKIKLNSGRIVTYIKRNDEVYHVSHFNPLLNSEFIDILIQNKAVPLRDNPNLFEFILQNNLDWNFRFALDEIEEYKNYIKNIDDFDIEIFAQKYTVTLKERGFNRPGKDDKAWLSIESTRPYICEKDSYLQSLFPKYERQIAEDSGYSWWSTLARELLDSLSEEEKDGLQKECINEENSVRENAIKNYSKENHLNSLIKQYSKLDAKLRSYKEK